MINKLKNRMRRAQRRLNALLNCLELEESTCVSRLEKIEALNEAGFAISRKADSTRVDNKLGKALAEVKGELDQLREEQRQRNNRRRSRR